MQSYRCQAVANLAAQLSRGPHRLRLRQLLNIEFLLSVVEPDKSYPYDFVCHVLTGFHPRSATSSDKCDASVPLLDGEALIEDLVRLAEELSLEANLTCAALSEDVYGVAELARRFDVSTKTIFRWHRRGLTGWRAAGKILEIVGLPGAWPRPPGAAGFPGSLCAAVRGP